MNSSGYPLRVSASLDPALNRWLWLVKWLLAIPHYLVLAVLWLCFAVLSVVAFFAILFTGRYPEAIFEFNVGVLRWSWRVTYYAYGALGTDRYPPFTLHDVADYPAHLEVSYPQHLSRGLVLVKWWLLAIPHYLVLAFFVGSGIYAVGQSPDGWGWGYGGGLITLLVLVAAVVLLFTGRYPRTIFDLVLGMNRWALRVAAYAGLMTDEYPPFRLDMGGDDPAPGTVTVGPPDAPATSTGDAPSQPPTTPSHWTAGRIISVTMGSLALLTAGAMLTAGITLAAADNSLRDGQGYIMTSTERFSTDSFAIVSETVHLPGGPGSWLPGSLLGRAKLTATPSGDGQVFVGVADSREADRYLSGVAHTTVVDMSDTADPVYRDTMGGAPSTSPADAGFWTAQAGGPGEREVTWPVDPGDWTLVVMNADGDRRDQHGRRGRRDLPVAQPCGGDSLRRRRLPAASRAGPDHRCPAAQAEDRPATGGGR